MAVVMDGVALAKKVKAGVAAEVARMAKKPVLAVILVGEDPASQIYVRHKQKDCVECGIEGRGYILPADTPEEKLAELIDGLNRDADVDGILLQLPLPKALEEAKVRLLRRIDPEKDVDAFHPINVGRMLLGDVRFAPCTPAGIMALLDEYGVDPKGKRCVIIGRSDIVGKPTAILLMHRHGTITVCHTRTKNMPDIVREAEILVSAAGRRGLVTGDMLSPGVVIVDVAMNRDENGKLCGDVDRAAALEKASYYTPVPGGVGPMTRAMLMRNTLTAAKLHGK
ncbi:MAG TPA: bifunctional 5,10-methylenetetrahydrofolate dehydrogenase/5,10-methenyltetrahydrofolate cyclohydrolase [Oscillospiraceae bacterium]|nr:bifunctional 5,10-methylenetetrahydrofolate dehydrogenase/5,10-methenyltetrahydrofolate cyclohydrolase [Oscillospiraceae bacterium]